jgi:protein TonB
LKKNTETVFTVVEESAMFSGGQDELIKYLALNIQYPKQAKVRGVEGLVYVSFVVEKDGSLTDIKLLRDIGSGCGQEALRVVKEMPKWRPAKLKCETVRMQFNLPVKFTLAD